MFGKIAGVVIIIASIIVAFWLGLIVLFIGGIEQLVNGLQAKPMDSSDIAWGVARLMFASLVGGLIGVFGVAMGIAVYEEGSLRSRRVRNRQLRQQRAQNRPTGRRLP